MKLPRLSTSPGSHNIITVLIEETYPGNCGDTVIAIQRKHIIESLGKVSRMLPILQP